MIGHGGPLPARRHSDIISHKAYVQRIRRSRAVDHFEGLAVFMGALGAFLWDPEIHFHKILRKFSTDWQRRRLVCLWHILTERKPSFADSFGPPVVIESYFSFEQLFFEF